MIVAEPRTQPLNGTTQAGPHFERAIREYVRAYASLHGRRKVAENLGVSRHTLWRFLERGHAGRAVPSAVLNKVGNNKAALEAATFEIIIDLEGLRPDPALRPLRQGLEEAVLLLCATPLATVDDLSRFGRVPASTLRDRLKKLTERGLVDSAPHQLSALGSRPQRRYFPTDKGVIAGAMATEGEKHMLRAYPVSRQWFRLLADRFPPPLAPRCPVRAFLTEGSFPMAPLGSFEGLSVHPAPPRSDRSRPTLSTGTGRVKRTGTSFPRRRECVIVPPSTQLSGGELCGMTMTLYAFTDESWEAAKEQVRRILIPLASDEKTIHFGDLFEKVTAVEFHSRRDRRFFELLNELAAEEYRAGRGLLTALVTNKETGLPGNGFFRLARVLGESFDDQNAFWASQFRVVVNYWKSQTTTDETPTRLVEDFTRELLDKYQEAVRVCNYRATVFRGLIEARGAVGACKFLLGTEEPAVGFAALWECGRLDLTLEATIADNPNWHPLFTEAELQVARRRLEELGYTPRNQH